MTPEELHETIQSYLADANAENAAGTHRGLVLVWASIMDDVLLRMLKAHLVELSAKQSKDMFGANGPLATFSSRTKMLFALGLLDAEEVSSIDLLRSIRNDFAHQLGLSLNDERLCDKTRIFGGRLTGNDGAGDPKHVFTGGCGALLMLLVNRLSRIKRVASPNIDRPLHERAFFAE